MNDNPYKASAMDRPERFFTAAQLEQLAGLRRVSLIIIGALVMGCVSFFAVTMVIAKWEVATFSSPLDSMITIFALAAAGFGIIVSQSIKPFLYQSKPMAGDAPTDTEIEAAQMQSNTELIIRSALLEGPCFFCLVAWLIEVNYWALVGAGACMFFLVLKLPSESQHLYDIQRRLTDHA